MLSIIININFNNFAIIIKNIDFIIIFTNIDLITNFRISHHPDVDLRLRYLSKVGFLCIYDTALSHTSIPGVPQRDTTGKVISGKIWVETRTTQ